MNQNSNKRQIKPWYIWVYGFSAVAYTIAATVMSFISTRDKGMFQGIIANRALDQIFAVLLFIAAAANWLRFVRYRRALRGNNEPHS